MRILHLDPDDIDNPLSGGGPRRTYEICRRLADRHEITVLTPTFPGATAERVRDGIRYLRLGRRIGDHGSSHHITYFFALPRAVLRTPHDLLVEDFMPPMSITLNPLFTRKPVIASAQWFFARTLARQYRIPFHWGEEYGLRLYRNFIVLTEAMARHVRSRVPRARVALIRNGVSEDLFAVGERPGRSILYLGRVDLHRKGVGLLLQSYAALPRARRLPLVLAGFGFEWDAVGALAQQLGIADEIRIVGRVDPLERRRLLEECRFVCFPSREETFGMVITEACAAARPVIHFDLPPMNEVADNAGCIAVPPFDVDAFAAAMAALTTAADDELAARGRACRARVQEYRWDSLARKQEAFYEEVQRAG